MTGISIKQIPRCYWDFHKLQTSHRQPQYCGILTKRWFPSACRSLLCIFVFVRLIPKWIFYFGPGPNQQFHISSKNKKINHQAQWLPIPVPFFPANAPAPALVDAAGRAEERWLLQFEARGSVRLPQCLLFRSTAWFQKAVWRGNAIRLLSFSITRTDSAALRSRYVMPVLKLDSQRCIAEGWQWTSFLSSSTLSNSLVFFPSMCSFLGKTLVACQNGNRTWMLWGQTSTTGKAAACVIWEAPELVSAGELEGWQPCFSTHITTHCPLTCLGLSFPSSASRAVKPREQT